jgi:hypothetical protein
MARSETPASWAAAAIVGSAKRDTMARSWRRLSGFVKSFVINDFLV